MILSHSAKTCYIYTMSKTIKAVYEKGVLKPAHKLTLTEHQEVMLKFIDPDDIPSTLIASVAEQGGSYDFLKRKGENIYSLRDGRSV